MLPAPASHRPRAGRTGKPRVYTLPIVRPAPPRPSGDAVRTW